jgi:hypothetical protein
MRPDKEPFFPLPSAHAQQIPFPTSNPPVCQLSYTSNHELVVADPDAGLMAGLPVGPVDDIGGRYFVRVPELRVEDAKLTKAAEFFGQFNLGR